MKKLLTLLGAFIAVAFTSCDKNNEPITSYVLVDRITTVDLTNGYTTDMRLGFAIPQSNGNLAPIDSYYIEADSEPVVYKQVITNDTVSQIVYTYEEDYSILVINWTSITGSHTLKYKLNDKQWATEEYVNGTFSPISWLDYNSDYARTKYLNTNISYLSGNYMSSTKGSQTTTYEYYSNLYNPFAIQQSFIPGVEYFWVCDHFGVQSKNMLKSVTTIENGVTVVYDFMYELAGPGYIVSQIISKNGVPLKKFYYHYATIYTTPTK